MDTLPLSGDMAAERVTARAQILLNGLAGSRTSSIGIESLNPTDAFAAGAASFLVR